MAEYSIGEFSIISRLSLKALRIYHERGILIPSRIDEMNGYRYYNEQSAERAAVIQRLKGFEFSLDEIQQMLEECGEDEDVKDYLIRKDQQIREKLERYSKMQESLEEIIRRAEENEMKIQTGTVEIKDVESITAACFRYTGRYDEMGKGIGLLFKYFGKFSRGKIFARYHDEEYKEADADIEVCLAISEKNLKKAQAVVDKSETPDSMSVQQFEAGRAAVIVHKGSYENLGKSYEKLFQYIKDQGLESKSLIREFYVKGPGMIFRGNPDKYLTEIQIMV
jgi:DNA-binding transcriptional MerR regulator